MPHHARFAELAPDPRIAPWVARVWEFVVHEGAPEMHHVPPDGCSMLLLSMIPGIPTVALISGPWLQPLAVPVSAGARFIGVRFRCGAAGVALGLDPATLVNQTRPARPVLGPEVDVLVSEVVPGTTLEQVAQSFVRFLESRTTNRALPSALVLRAAECIEAGQGARTMVEVARMRAFTAEGRWMHMELTIGEKGYSWTMTDPRAGKIRYEMVLDAEGRWIESGSRQQGAESVKFFEMTLTRK